MVVFSDMNIQIWIGFLRSSSLLFSSCAAPRRFFAQSVSQSADSVAPVSTHWSETI